MSLYRGLFCFTNDLRLKDNLALSALIRQSTEIAFVYVFDTMLLKANNYQQTSIGQHRLDFILQSLDDLRSQLSLLGHQLHVCYGKPDVVISHIVQSNKINLVGYSDNVGWNEIKLWQRLKQKLTQVKFVSEWSDSLFSYEQMNEFDTEFSIFSQFRRKIEKYRLEVSQSCQTWLDTLPNPFVIDTALFDQHQMGLPLVLASQHQQKSLMLGGELSALKHLHHYFSSDLPSTYKVTRNELDGFDNSTKFSPFLAHGNLSARQIWTAVRQYEAQHGANDSTYWIGFELLWREYFHWLALRLATQLFNFKGGKQTAPLTSYFPERFQKWCHGTTPYPLVNACMKQLNATGYMSNRGRQIVASCLVNELGVDWRYGAAYFEKQLIDYDVASNWGNWQYIAGVGADPRGGRHFNIAKQSKTYDPDNVFIQKWQGEQGVCHLDSVDAADWPMSAEMSSEES